MCCSTINWQNFKGIFRFLIIFIVTYIIGRIIINLTNVKFISVVNLNTFSFLLSLITATVILLLENDILILRIKLPLSFRSNRLVFFCATLLIGTLILILVYEGIYFRQIAFDEWSNMSLLRITYFLIVFSVTLYAPAYILHKLLLRKFKWCIIEKFIFYPVLGAILFVLMKVIRTIINIVIPHVVILLTLLSGMLIVFLSEHRRNTNNPSSPCYLDINLKEVLALTVAIGFNLFIFYSALGGENAFLRGDMWGEAHTVAFFNRYDLNAYLESPIENYPLFYSFFWSAILELLPFPYLNGLLFIAFFNHVFSILAFYMLAKLLFKDSKTALLSVILWTTLSGFSWINLMLNPPTSLLSGNELLNYISKCSQRFGVHSGSMVSPIYADDHALTRLWSLGLYFVSVSALLKAYLNERNLTEGMLIFLISMLQILLGHITEVTLIALVLFLLVLLKDNTSSKFTKIISLTTLFSSIIGAFFIILTQDLSIILILTSFTPLLAVLLSVFFCKISNIRIKSAFVNSLSKIGEKTKIFFFVLFLYVYGLMWLAFSELPVGISWSIATLWYSPAVEWGFLGLISVPALAWFGLKRCKLHFGLKFAILLFLLQLIFLIGLNYLNYNFFYIQTPYPFQPILFLPIFALISSAFLSAIVVRRKILRKIRFILVVVLVITIFSLGAIDHILSASYWKTNNGWWLRKPLNPSYEDFELINFLYARSPLSSYEFVGTPYDWKEPSSYVIYPSGMAVLSKPLIDILWYTNDSREIYLLKHVFPINYILVSKESPLPPPKSLRFDGVDDYVEISNSESLNMSVFTIEAWIKLNSYSPYLCPIVDRATNAGGYSFWIGGEKHSKGKLILNGGLDNDAESDILYVNVGEWTHVAVVWDGNTTTFYKNGISETRTGYTFRNVGPLTTRIGNERWAFRGQFFNGYIAQVRIYNRALDENEIFLRYYQNYLIRDGLVLWLSLKNGNEVEKPYISIGEINGTIFGAKLHISSYILNAVNDIDPIFANEKYVVYSLQQLNFSKTSLLPSSTDFITVKKILFNGNLTLRDELNNTITIQNAKGEIYPVDEGEIQINAKCANNVTINNVKFLTPHVNLSGNITLIEMKSTWGYFSESFCTANKIVISGHVSFKIFNTVKNRIYLESFSYKGQYTAFPFPTYFRPDYAKKMVELYLQANYVDPVKVIQTTLGIIWTMIIIIVLMLTLFPSKIIQTFHLIQKRIFKITTNNVHSKNYVRNGDVAGWYLIYSKQAIMFKNTVRWV